MSTRLAFGVAAAVTALVAVGALTACSTGQTEPLAASRTPSPTPSSGVVLPTDPDRFVTPVPDGTIDEDTGEEVVQQPVADWSSDDRAVAIAAAEAVMTAFARPDMSKDAWWADLQPMLSQQASLDYSYVEPAAVPARRVTGAGAIVDDRSAYVASVNVPTDVGTYTILLSRANGDAPWQAERITPPEGIN